MIRIFVFLLALVAAAALITIIANIQGSAEIRAFGMEFYPPVGALVGVLVMLAFALVGLTIFAKDIAALPAKFRQRQRDERRGKGMVALTRGLEAVAAGDAEDAQRHARTARKQLDEPALTRLLTAQAAHLAGDEQTAEQAFSAMLEAPETEFLGLRGLYLQAMTRHDTDKAKNFAERAFRLRPNAKWAFDSVYQLSLDRGAWGEARDTLKLASRQGQARDEKSYRQETALLTARAYASDAAGEKETAQKDLEAALKLNSDFTPAVTLLARLYTLNGKTAKGLKLIDEAWKKSPHLSLRRTAETLLADRPQEEQHQKLRALAALSPEHQESRLLSADIDLAEKNYTAAQAILEPLLSDRPTSRIFRAMATIMRATNGDEKAREWMDLAANAPKDSPLGADGIFHLTTDGWQRLIAEYGDYGRLVPPPLEEINSALSSSDIKRLTAPPEKPKDEEATTQAQDENAAPIKAKTPPKPSVVKLDEAEAAPEPPRPDWTPYSDDD